MLRFLKKQQEQPVESQKHHPLIISSSGFTKMVKVVTHKDPREVQRLLNEFANYRMVDNFSLRTFVRSSADGLAGVSSRYCIGYATYLERMEKVVFAPQDNLTLMVNIVEGGLDDMEPAVNAFAQKHEVTGLDLRVSDKGTFFIFQMYLVKMSSGRGRPGLQAQLTSQLRLSAKPTAKDLITDLNSWASYHPVRRIGIRRDGKDWVGIQTFVVQPAQK